jgi:hypothetical protein
MNEYNNKLLIKTLTIGWSDSCNCTYEKDIDMQKQSILLLVIFCFVISGCHVLSENQSIFGKSAVPKILPGQGGIIGQVIIDQNGTPNPGAPVHLAEVFRSNNKAAYIIDASNSLSSVTNEVGKFSFLLIPTGEYVIIIGDPLSEHLIVMDESGKAIDLVVQPDQIVDAGTIQFGSN